MNQVQEELERNLNLLAKARESAEALKLAKREMIENVQQSDDFMKLDILSREGDALITELESSIRAAALALHAEFCELPSRVTVKNFTVVTISDEAKAREWCLTNFRPALKLDAKTFEKAAKDGTVPADLATITKEARAQIATKL
jgi:hypothetical protein